MKTVWLDWTKLFWQQGFNAGKFLSLMKILSKSIDETQILFKLNFSRIKTKDSESISESFCFYA
jgi:hypothetical protein